MADERLHEYGLDLCDYILGQIRPHLGTLPERPTSAPTLHYGEWNRLDLSTWLGRGVAALPAPLADHVWAGVVGDKVMQPLNDTELFALTAAVADPPMRLDARCVWEPSPALHRRSVECVSEIRSALTKQNAEQWVEDSAGFAARLCGEGLSLANGIATVHEWLWSARRLLGAMGDAQFLPYPHGTHPTPTHPDPSVPPAESREPVVAEQVRTQVVVKENPPEPRDSAVCGWRDAMAITGLKKTKLYELFRRGILKGYRDGSMIRFYRTGLLTYMREREIIMAPPPRPARPARRPRKAGTPTPRATRFKFL